MITPKEEAKELVDKFYMPLPLKREVITKVKKIPFEYNDWGVAKQCALIAVDFAMNSKYSFQPMHGGWVSGKRHYEELKEEIEKL